MRFDTQQTGRVGEHRPRIGLREPLASPEVRERMEAVCDQFKRAHPAPKPVAEPEPRNVLPRNNFGGDDKDADMRAAGSKALLKALEAATV